MDTFGSCVKHRSLWIPLLCCRERSVPTLILREAFLGPAACSAAAVLCQGRHGGSWQSNCTGQLMGVKVSSSGAGGLLASTVFPFNQFSYPAHYMAAQKLVWYKHGAQLWLGTWVGMGWQRTASYSSSISFWWLECSWERWLHSPSEWEWYGTQTSKWVITMWPLCVRMFFLIAKI